MHLPATKGKWANDSLSTQCDPCQPCQAKAPDLAVTHLETAVCRLKATSSAARDTSPSPDKGAWPFQHK